MQNIQYLKDVPKKIPSKKYSVIIDDFIYYVKKLTNNKYLKEDIYSVYNYPSGYLLFSFKCTKLDNPIDVLTRKLLARHNDALKLHSEFINTKKEESIFKCIENTFFCLSDKSVELTDRPSWLKKLTKKKVKK